MADSKPLSTLVWYDDQHLSGHVKPTKITSDDDGRIHWNQDTQTDSLRVRGETKFKGLVTGNALNVESTVYSVAGDLEIKPWYLYTGLDNIADTAGITVTLPDVDARVKSVGGCASVISYMGAATGAPPIISVRIDSFEVGGYADPVGVELSLGQIVFCMWVNAKWRLIQTNGIVE